MAVSDMPAPRQGDLFGREGLDPSDEDFETPVYYPDPDKVREELNKILAAPVYYPDPDKVRGTEQILAEARAAKVIPWDSHRAALYRTIFPQMSGCLPENEGAQLRFDFETEMARLEAA